MDERLFLVAVVEVFGGTVFFCSVSFCTVRFVPVPVFGSVSSAFCLGFRFAPAPFFAVLEGRRTVCPSASSFVPPVPSAIVGGRVFDLPPSSAPTFRAAAIPFLLDLSGPRPDAPPPKAASDDSLVAAVRRGLFLDRPPSCPGTSAPFAPDRRSTDARPSVETTTVVLTPVVCVVSISAAVPSGCEDVPGERGRRRGSRRLLDDRVVTPIVEEGDGGSFRRTEVGWTRAFSILFVLAVACRLS